MKKTLYSIVKKVMIGIISIIVLVIITATIFINTSPQFGGKPTENDLIRIKSSPNFDGKSSFKNLETTQQTTGFKLSTLPKFFTNGNNEIPNKLLPQKQLNKEFFTNSSKKSRITWFGHSTILVEMEETTIFIDPMLGSTPAPHPLLGNKRFNKELPITIKDLPKIDVVLISHDHYDHLDYESIKQLKEKVTWFYVPLGIKAHLIKWGVSENAIKEFDWWENSTLNGIKFISTPARHFSGRGFTRNNTLWCSWVLKSDNNAIYFSGDSGYGKHFKEIGEKYGPFDFAMMECGQYNEQWAQIHMMPEETIQASIDINTKKVMPIHWGAFKLALHDWKDPVIRATNYAEKNNVSIVTPIIGETLEILDTTYINKKWWVKF